MSPYVVAAIITGACAVVAALVSAAAVVLVARLRRDVKTNHGKRPGEYLEMIPVILELLAEHIGDPEAHDHPQRLVLIDGTATANT